ncbi:uncharacterized protein RCC_06849 [Ramularia collo-cygni]|uniref:Uncharacterized protein n=1 Tax=Ramularia collo-cygni TaxID=112498 RepID=A0A2D3UZQ2_9PEZI|nr:uncharacterized protein RCC_06849 [Ramularia collo-cygni]CZT20988.1 uncharacterized protein RCC_06849 [Ramularia collo-cygni]
MLPKDLDMLSCAASARISVVQKTSRIQEALIRFRGDCKGSRPIGSTLDIVTIDSTRLLGHGLGQRNGFRSCRYAGYSLQQSAQLE